ncbi:MAG TPA: hypothetical protein GXX14_10805 [Clostridiaceae bacterium]|nr:hypothetical protein [Clostridiaceae bacterium]
MKFKIGYSEKAERIVKSLSVKELINQIICPLYKDVPAVENCGGAYFAADTRENLRKKVDTFVESCSIPPFVVSDFECGASMILDSDHFPSMMGLSQCNSEELAYEAGRIAAEEGAELGFNWTLAPVADLAFNPDSPVVGLRSAGKYPEQAIKAIKAYMKGVQDFGMLATAKHFPGDGFSTYDQHLTTPENPLDMESWHKLSGYVFREMINEGVAAVMTGHISLPAYDEKDRKLGLFPPSTLSRRLIQDLLKTELGFEGLVISDAMIMGGCVGFMNCYEACARFLESGGDMLLFVTPDENFYRQMEQLIENGKLKLETLRDRAYRILAVKDKMGLLDGTCKAGRSIADTKRNSSIVKEVAERSITIVRDRENLLPFNVKRETRVLYLVIVNGYEVMKGVYDGFCEEIRKYSDHVDMLVDPGPFEIEKRIKSGDYDLVICSIGNYLDWAVNVVRLHGPVARNMACGWMKMGVPVIFISHFHPYVHKEYEAAIDTIINTYGHTTYTNEYLMKGICGLVPLQRKLHVHD